MRKSVTLTLALALPACVGSPPPPLDSAAIAVSYEISTLDPHAEDKVANFSVLSNAYEPLVLLDAEMKVKPCLAQSWESPDAVTWVFRLRPGVTFHGGRRLRSDDVVWSLRRVMGRSDLEVRNYLRDVVDVARIDEGSLRVRTDHPTRALLNKLSFVPIVPEASSDDALRRAEAGTGPYVLEQWSSGSVRFRRHEGYWGPKPALSGIQFFLGRSPEEAMAGLAARRYELIQCDSKKAAVAFAGSREHRVVRRDNLFVKYLAFDLAREATPFCSIRPNPFRDLRVRRAIDAAIDRHRLVSELWRYAVPATQPIPRSVFGFDPSIPETVHDPDQSRNLLRAAGVGRFGVTLHARRILAEAAPLLKEDLAAIGIDVEVKVLPDAEFFALVGNAGASFWLNRFSCLSGDASELLEDLVHSRDVARRYGTINYAGHHSPDLDRAIEESAAIDRPGDRRSAVQGVVRRVVADLVVIPLFNDQDVYVLDARLSWQPRSDSTIRAAEIALAP